MDNKLDQIEIEIEMMYMEYVLTHSVATYLLSENNLLKFSERITEIYETKNGLLLKGNKGSQFKLTRSK